MVYLGPGQQLSNESYRFQVTLSQQKPPLLQGDLHLKLLLLFLLLSPRLLHVPPILSLLQLLLSLPQPLLLLPLLLFFFLLLLFPDRRQFGIREFLLALNGLISRFAGLVYMLF